MLNPMGQINKNRRIELVIVDGGVGEDGANAPTTPAENCAIY